MRIGIITGEFPPMQGGMGDYSLALARELVALGHEVFVLTSHLATPIHKEHGIHVQASVVRWGRWASIEDRKHKNTLRGEAQAIEWIRQNKIGVVNIQYEPAAYRMEAAVNFLPRNLSKSVAVVATTFHDLLVPYLFPKAGNLRKRVVYQMAKESSGVIVTNLEDERELSPITDKPLIRIPIGSNIGVNPPADYDREQWRKDMIITPDTFLIGYFGFVNASKGIDTLASAVRLAVQKGLNAHLLMIGGQTGDSDKSNIEQADEAQRLISGLGISRRVSWTGFVESETVSAYLMACDVVALPFKDGVSFRRGTLMAALAHGCPIITTHPQVELPELDGEKEMRLVPADNPHRLAEVLIELAQNPEQRQRLSEAALKLASHFRWDNIAAQTVQFFETLLTARIRENSD